MSCPHCGAEPFNRGAEYWEGWECWDCGTDRMTADVTLISRGTRCYERQISQLKAELAQSVRRDDPRLKEIADALGAHSNSMQVVNAKDKLQSIIEGK